MESLRWLFGRLRALPRIALKIGGVAAAALFLLYFPLGYLLFHTADGDPDFGPGEFAVEGGSHAVSVAAALIDRETRVHHWVPNDPFFYPTALLERMPAFQAGMVSALSRFAVEMGDQVGRTRGSSQIDPDLDKAVGLLKYPPDVWMFDFPSTLLPTVSSENRYREAMDALMRYNRRLAKGEAVFDRRADNLQALLERIASDLGSASGAIANHIDASRDEWIDTSSETIYYDIKGRMYAYYLILRELRRDFAPVIQERQLQGAWEQMLASLREGAALSVFFAFTPAPDSQLIPNHLAAQGFYLLRARTQIKEVSNILLK